MATLTASGAGLNSPGLDGPGLTGSGLIGAGVVGRAPAVTALRASARRRNISQEAGRALEMLGHAIEYLTDEHIHRGGDLSAHNPDVEAIQLLMARNRQVYFACPEIPTLADRCRAFLHLHRA